MIYDCGFNITALKMSNLDRANCEEFYEIYKGVVPEYVVCSHNFFFPYQK